MRIDILAIGSLGDVQPYVALGLGLQKVGHRIRIVTLSGFEEVVRGHGLDHLSIVGSLRDIVDTAAGRNWIAHRTSTLGFLRGFVRVAGSLIEAGIASYWHACRDVEALIVSPMGLLVGAHIAERLRAPLIRTQVYPRYDWEGRRNLVAAVRGEWTVFLGAVFQLLIWSKLRRSTNAARWKILALPPLPLREPFSAMDRDRIPLLQAYSPAVVPRPPHWGDWIHVTGYWFLDDPTGWVPPGELVDFLGSGPPPVFVGFGSTPFPEPEAATDLVVRALARAGQRGVLVAGESGLATGRLNDDVLSVDFVPHGWLFPQVCAAVHHGGAGVTGAALRAGLPSIAVPVFGDHPFWGQRVFKLGAGPRPIPAKRLTDDALASAIRATASKEMRRRAAALGEQIRGEDGVARAVEAIHEHVAAEAIPDTMHVNR
jgi:UDP:flavonoid glycosyltransferase YjiC (YdhE family)